MKRKFSLYKRNIVFDIQNCKYEFHYPTTIEILRFCSNVLKGLLSGVGAIFIVK